MAARTASPTYEPGLLTSLTFRMIRSLSCGLLTEHELIEQMILKYSVESIKSDFAVNPLMNWTLCMYIMYALTFIEYILYKC